MLASGTVFPDIFVITVRIYTNHIPKYSAQLLIFDDVCFEGRNCLVLEKCSLNFFLGAPKGDDKIHGKQEKSLIYCQ